MGKEDAPNAPNPSVEYQKGIEIYLKKLPELLAAEQTARETYDPTRIAEQQTLQDIFGSTQYRQQLDALHQLDPESWAVRTQLANRVRSDLDQGYNLPEDYAREIETGVRGAQVARGNALGSSAAGAEGAVKGSAAMDMYNRRLANAGTFLSSPTPTQQISQVQGVQPDRSNAYTNPNAGFAGQNFALSNYQNQLAQYQLSGGGASPWASALGGAASGAAVGSAAGPWGTVIGAAAGGALGYFSSRKIKRDIVPYGTSAMGFPRVEFSYLDSPKRFRGTIAEEVQKIMPEAVFEKDGILAVRYDMIDVDFQEVN
jgi:hypothetical protein